jgi:hypothetical protein
MPNDPSALQLILTADPTLLTIVKLSLLVSLSATLLAALVGLPFGALIALTRFRGREAVIVALNALMGLPPVVVGLAIYLALSRSGPLVLKEGKPFLVTGSPGGPTIINTVLLIITNVIDHGLTVTQAVDAPRFHHQWQPDVIGYEPFFTSPDSMAVLRNEGYTFMLRMLYPNAPAATAHTWGYAETILVDPHTGLPQGANDLRSPDSAAVGW